MRLVKLRRRLSAALRDESGISLPEILVVSMMMMIVLFALYQIFDTSLRVFSFGNDKIESTENARVALERMEREIRAAFPYDLTAASPVGRRLDPSTSNAGRITFYNDVGDNANAAYNNDGKGTGDKETISYYASGGTLVRQEGSATPQPLAPLGPGGTLQFAYFNKLTGAEITPPISDENSAGMVRIRLVVVEDGGVGADATQELITNAALRNRGT